MNITPELNLNLHPKYVKDGSLVGATNMMINEDTPILQTENSITKFITQEMLDNAYSFHISAQKTYKLITYIPCNKEVVLIYKVNNIGYFIYRYNEETNQLKICRQIDIQSDTSEFTSTFTYNKGELIIAISEFSYKEDIKIPLKTINLGTWENTTSISINDNRYSYLDSIIPEVIIPTINVKQCYGNSYKGWYYIFIRYKLSNNNYTQWYNTNASIFIDDYILFNKEDYYIGRDNLPNDSKFGWDNFENDFKRTYVQDYISDSKYTCNKTFLCNIENFDNRYNNYQLGFICTTKSFTKCFRTEDLIFLNRDNNIDFIFNLNKVVEESLLNMTTNYYNYYNVKTISNYNNALYISNYKEDVLEKNINVSNIKLIINFNTINKNINKSRASNTIYNYICIYGNKEFNIKSYSIDGYKCIEADQFICYDSSGNLLQVKIEDNHTISFGTIGSNYFNPIITGTKSKIVYDIINRKYYKIDNNKVIYIYNDQINYMLNVDGELYSIVNCNAKFNTTSSEGNIGNIPGENITNDIIINNDITLDTIKNNECYNFFIHFVNKYGISTKGFQINKFDITINDELFFIKEINNTTNNSKYLYIRNSSNDFYLSFKIDKFPSEEFIGYFITYEKINPVIKYKGFIKKENNIDNYCRFYNDKIFTDDIIDLNFDKVQLYRIQSNMIVEEDTNSLLNREAKTSSTITTEYSIEEKQLLLPDVYNNITKSGCILLKLDQNIENGWYYAELYKSEKLILDSSYNNKYKELIPCSNINYNINTVTYINTHNNFNSKIHALIFIDGIIYNTALNAFQMFTVDGNFNNISNGNIVNPFINIVYTTNEELPNESFQVNNNPIITIFPIKGIEKGENERKYSAGTIVDIKNTIDLYKQPHTKYYENYPKILTNYNEDEKILDTFPKTIRRSNIIQDESDELSWRFFETDAYKNIIENKGDIIKLSTIGNIVLVHTEHSLFQFQADAVLLTHDDEKINIGNNDIFKLDYKEVFTSQYGYDGLSNHNHSIIGVFGYIWYSADTKKIYRYDAGNMNQIDININDFIRKLNLSKLNLDNIRITNDVERNRIIFTFNNIGLSYNYKYNVFVSLHKRNYIKGFNTKTKTYLLNNDSKDCEIYTFNENRYGDYLNKNNNYNDCEILINTNYDENKVLEFIQYSINKCNNVLSLINNKDNEYSGETLRIYSQTCDTGDIDITFDSKNLNSARVPNKPYRYGSDWNFNFIRNNIKDYPNIVSDLNSQVYGKWFVIKLIFTPVTTRYNKIEIESINCVFNKRLT